MIKQKFNDGVAEFTSGTVKDALESCIDNGIINDNYKLFAKAWVEKLDSNGLFCGEFFGKWITAAVNAYRYKPSSKLFDIMKDAVETVLSAQEDNGRLSCSATDFTTWDLWGRKYALLGLLAYYGVTKDEKVIIAVKNMADDIILSTAHLNFTETGIPALQGLAACSILKPFVLLYKQTLDKKYLDFAEKLVFQWSESSAFNKNGIHLIEDALDKKPPVYISAPKAYEAMSCYEGLCELYTVTENENYLNAALSYMNMVCEREIMITGSGSSGELWCDGKYRQTQVLEAPMETCVTATYMRMCHKLLCLTADPIWADRLEISLFNALLGAIKKDGSWWAYFSPLQGQRVPSRVQIDHVNSSCCVVNGPRALTEVCNWAIMSTDNSVVVNLYQPGIYKTTIHNSQTELEQKTDYPCDGNVIINIVKASKEPFEIKLRVPSWCENAKIEVNGEKIKVNQGYTSITRAWKSSDVIKLYFDMGVKTISAPKNEIYKALMFGPLVLALDNRKNSILDNSLWLMSSNEEPIFDDMLNCNYYPPQSIANEIVPIVNRNTECNTLVEFSVKFLVKPVHFFNHKTVDLTFCDYASCGSFEEDSEITTWFPVPFCGNRIFPQNSRHIIDGFTD